MNPSFADRLVLFLLAASGGILLPVVAPLINLIVSIEEIAKLSTGYLNSIYASVNDLFK